LKEKPGQTGMLSSPNEETIRLPSRRRRDGLTLRAIFLIYFIFGFAYNIYATYFVAYMVEEIGLSGKMAGDMWALFGWMCMVSGLIWGFLSDRLGRREALLWNNGIISLSVFISLLFHQPFLLGLSAFLFGSTFLGTVTVIAACMVIKVRKGLLFMAKPPDPWHGHLEQLLGGYFKDLTGSSLTLLPLVGFLSVSSHCLQQED
jgi:predicted MFS family arabinose efflux permease